MILVVSKTSQFDIKRASIESMIENGTVCQEHLARLKKAHDEHVSTHQKLIKSLKENKLQYTEISRGEKWPDLEGIKAVVTVGGDGTVLEASHNINCSDVSLIGIKSSSMSVGFLCYTTEKGIPELSKQLKQNTVHCLTVERINAVIKSKSGNQQFTSPVLNDFLFTNQNPAEMTRYSLVFEEKEELHKSSGIWVATAAGSTAAISAAGGTIFPIEHKSFQFLVREPYCPPGGCYMKTKSEFIPEKNNIVIRNRCDNALLALDGQHEIINLTMGDVITFARSAGLRLARQQHR